MTIKQKINNNLQYYWWVYVLFSLVLVLLWSMIFSSLNKIPSEDELYLFLGADISEEDVLKEKINDAVEGEIKKIKFDQVSPNSSFFSYQFLIRGTKTADIFILSEDKIEKEYCGALFPEITPKCISEYFLGATEFFIYDEKIYGLKIYDGKNNTGIFANYINGDIKDYYLFFNQKSLNIGMLNIYLENSRNEALLAVKALFDY